MSSPARDERLLSISLGYTQVHRRGSNSISMRNPTTNKIRAVYGMGHGWHYGAGLETDTAWVTGVAPWNYQITKANYNLFALSQLNQGQILKWLDPASGQSITFQPMALQWTNSLNQIQQISMPQSVAAQVNDDILYWPAGYGAGRHFKYIASPSRLNKLLIIDSVASLPATSYDTLELNFIMDMSSGVTAYIDSGSGLAAWDKKTQRDTVKAIEFRLSNGNVVWSFAVPTAYDSSGNPETGFITGIMRLKKQGSSLYVSVRFPKSWIDSAVFPIMLDPTVDYQVGASGDDGVWYGTTFQNNVTVIGLGQTASYQLNYFARWSGVTIPDGATITTSYISLYFYDYVRGTPAACDLYFEDAADPAAITSAADGNGRTKTAATIKITSPTSGTWWNSNSISTIIQELIDTRSYSNAAMQMIIVGPAAGAANFADVRQYDYSGNTSGFKLHIEYTEAAGGTWAGTWGG